MPIAHREAALTHHRLLEGFFFGVTFAHWASVKVTQWWHPDTCLMSDAVLLTCQPLHWGCFLIMSYLGLVWMTVSCRRRRCSGWVSLTQISAPPAQNKGVNEKYVCMCFYRWTWEGGKSFCLWYVSGFFFCSLSVLLIICTQNAGLFSWPTRSRLVSFYPRLGSLFWHSGFGWRLDLGGLKLKSI